jgi:hypothetical protein
MGSTVILTTGFILRAAFDLALVLGGLGLPFLLISLLGT